MFKPVVGNEAPRLRAAKLSKADRKLNIFLDNWTEIIQTESFSFKINIFCLSPNVSSSKNGFQRSIVLTSFLWWKVLSFSSRGVKHTRRRSFLMCVLFLLFIFDSIHQPLCLSGDDWCRWCLVRGGGVHCKNWNEVRPINLCTDISYYNNHSSLTSSCDRWCFYEFVVILSLLYCNISKIFIKLHFLPPLSRWVCSQTLLQF